MKLEAPPRPPPAPPPAAPPGAQPAGPLEISAAPPNPPSPIDVFNPGLREKTERSNFAVDVDRGGNTLGLGLKFVERKLLVNQVKPGGAIETYNAANPDNSIRKEDLIVCVNDIELDPAKMVREIKMKSKLRLVVERPL